MTSGDNQTHDINIHRDRWIAEETKLTANDHSKKQYTMFVDESGVANIQTDTHFSVVGVIFKSDYAYSHSNTKVPTLRQQLEEFRNECFDDRNKQLHLLDILKREKEFTKQKVTSAQVNHFFHRLPDFLQGIEFTIISVTVDKKNLKKLHPEHKEPYTIAFYHIMKSFYAFLSKESNVDSAGIVVESRDDHQNFIIQKAFFEIISMGTLHLEFKEQTRSKIRTFLFAKKTDPVYQYGLEIADLLCSPISRVRIGKIELRPKNIEYGDENRVFNAIEHKIFVYSEEQDKLDWGFKKAPMIQSNQGYTE